MKTTLIQLDENDDILSIKDKMQWNPSKRILLIVPHNNKSIHRRIDLVSLQRVARKNGAQLALSTSQKYLHGLGKLTGVKVFSTVLAAQKQDWPDYFHEVQKPESPTRNEVVKLKEYIADRKKGSQLPNSRKILFFTLGTLAPIVLVLALIPHATITLHPAQTVQNLLLDFSASPAYLTPSVEGRIPAFVRILSLSTTDTIPTTGETSIPDQFASGAVRITNLTENGLYLPAHLRLNTGNSSNLQFQTLDAVSIPAGKGQFVDVPISALTAGKGGNLPPQSVTSIAGPYGSLLQVTNLTSTKGGTDIQVKAVSVNDFQLLKSQLSQKLQSDVLSQTKNSSSTIELIVPQSMEVVNETVSTNLETGDPGDQLIMEMTGTYHFLFLNEDEIKQLVITYAAASIPPGYQQVTGSLHNSDPMISSFQVDDELIRGQIKIAQSIQGRVDNSGIVRAILGKTRKQAVKIIASSKSTDQTPKITLSPSFWFWMPIIPGQIVLENPGVK